MATKDTPKSGDVTGEETEPEPFLRQEKQEAEDEVNGIPGQIVYPDRVVDAERAAAFAGGKVDSLDPNAEDESGWQNPADRSGEVTTQQTDQDQPRATTTRSESSKSDTKSGTTRTSQAKDR